MGSKQIVKVVGVDYEPETLNSITEPAARDYAFDVILDYAKARFPYEDNEKGGIDFKPTNPAERKKINIFNSITDTLGAILAADRRCVLDFDVIDTLLAGVQDGPEDLEKLYQAAIKANPQLKTSADKAKEAEMLRGDKASDPLAA